MRYRSSLILLVAALAACQSAPPDNGEVSSPASVAVAAAAARVKARPPATPANPGLLLSGWADKALIASMDETDRLKNHQAENRAGIQPIGQPVTWNNAKNGDSGIIIPLRDGYSNNGAYCRDFKQTVSIGGQLEQGQGQLCQQPDGSWQRAK